MEATKVKHLMVPLSRYATVPEEASLYEAVMALEETRRKFDREYDRHRAILILDANKRIVGKVDLWDLLKGIEPKFKEIGYPRELTERECSDQFSSSMVRTYGLWSESLKEVCSNAAKTGVREIMHVPAKLEYIDGDSTLEEAMHRLLTGNLLSLLVIQESEVSGILRLSDVLREIVERIKACSKKNYEEVSR